MPFFIDTSALFKRYQVEKGTGVVCDILEKGDSDLFMSSLTIIEVVSNLKRLFEIDRVTTQEQFATQRSFFYHDIDNLNITILDVTSDDIIRADELILKRYMKPIDSIQLAIALNLKINKLAFVAADKKLCNVAREEGLRVVNPTDD